MLDNQSVSAAAGAVISVVDRDRMSHPNRPSHNNRDDRRERSSFYTLEGEVASELYRHLDMTIETSVRQAIEQARREEVSTRLGHLDPRDLSGGDWYENQGGQTRAERLRILFGQAMDEIDELVNHRCTFAGDDYCVICRCDGRA